LWLVRCLWLVVLGLWLVWSASAVCGWSLGFGFLLHTTPLIVVTVGGISSRALRVGFADGPLARATLDEPPPTARAAGIGVRQGN